ncbi:MAG: PAS domain-containing protein [Anaerolineae bacterium]
MEQGMSMDSSVWKESSACRLGALARAIQGTAQPFVATTADGQIVEANPAFGALLGYTAADASKWCAGCSPTRRTPC